MDGIAGEMDVEGEGRGREGAKGMGEGNINEWKVD